MERKKVYFRNKATRSLSTPFGGRYDLSRRLLNITLTLDSAMQAPAIQGGNCVVTETG